MGIIKQAPVKSPKVAPVVDTEWKIFENSRYSPS
jgi:hypothetical protein